MKKQVKDFNSATSLNSSTDFFLMQRVATDGTATTLKVQLQTLKESVMSNEDDSGGGSGGPALVFTPLVKIIGANGPVTAINPLVNSQLFITDVGDAAGIDIVSSVHRTSRINFRHGDTDFAANIFTCGPAFTPIGGSRRLYIDVGNPTAVNRFEMSEKFSVFYKDVYIVNGTLSFESRLSSEDTLPGSANAVLHIQNSSSHAIIDTLAASTHASGIFMRNYNSNFMGAVTYSGPDSAFGDEKNTLFIRNVVLKPGSNEIVSANTFKLGLSYAELSVPLTVNDYLFANSNGLAADGTPNYEGGQLSLGCSHQNNTLKTFGAIDFLKAYYVNGAYSDMNGKTREQYPHWSLRHYLGIPSLAGTPTEYSMLSDGSFIFSFYKNMPHFTGDANSLPKFIVQKLAGGGNVQADAHGNLSIASSDQRLKTNIANIQYGVKEIERLRPVQFNWLENDMFYFRPNITDFGLIAQEVAETFPNLIAENPVGYLTLDYTKLVPVLIKAVQELSAEIKLLKNSI